jgi:hypothetical protein
MVKEVGVNYINLFSGINVFMHEKDIGNPHFCINLDTKTRIDLTQIYVFMFGMKKI